MTEPQIENVIGFYGSVFDPLREDQKTWEFKIHSGNCKGVKTEIMTITWFNAPNWLHRKMQWWLLGFKWERLK